MVATTEKSPPGFGLSRRGLLGACAAGLAAGGLPGGLASAQPAAPPESLSQAARAVGLRFGSDSDVDLDRTPPAYQALFARNCDLYAANLPWSRVQPAPDAPVPSWQDPSIPSAFGHGMQLTGGHFLWYQRLPAWFEALADAHAAEAAIARYVTGMAGHYAGRVFSWNVANEAVSPKERRPDGLRNTVLTRIFGGDGYMPAAFHAARGADPKALLLYNDYDLEMDTPEHERRRRAVLALIDRLLAQRAPIDGLGMQAHLRLDGSRFDPDIHRRFLAEIASRGLRIVVTELDILDLDTPADDAARDARVAGLYKAYLDATLDERAVKGLVMWGLSDRFSWWNGRTGSRNARADGLPPRPDVFDRDFAPKPAYGAVLAALRHAPSR